MNISKVDPHENRILNGLSDQVLSSFMPSFDLVSLARGKVIYDPGSTLNHVYFPINCTISMLHLTESGATAEIALVGNEGLVGLPLFMGGGSMSNQAIIQCPGFAYRLPKSAIKRDINQIQAINGLQELVLRYTLAFITQASQTAVCNRHHTLDQQLCRWLLINLDRLPTSEICVTQEWVAHMLGVRREGVTLAAGNLQRAGLIECGRGRIWVLDRIGLEKRVCECYKVVKTEYDRLLPKPNGHAKDKTNGLGSGTLEKRQKPCVNPQNQSPFTHKIWPT